MVGNDIVDLAEAQRASRWQRSGFLDKIYTPEEQSLIHAAKDSFRMVWQLWSMKESAYKVYIQAGGTRFFNPRKIVCRLETPQKGQVQINHCRFSTQSSLQAGHIASTAVSQAKVTDIHIGKVLQLPLDSVSQQSAFLHTHLMQVFASHHDLDVAELRISKTAAGVPFFQYKDKTLPTSVSMSHHGQFGTYVWM